MKLTTNHPSSSYNMPIFIDEDGNPMDYNQAIKQLCQDKGWTYQDLADRTGVSNRTAQGWGQGRPPSKSALMLIANLL